MSHPMKFITIEEFATLKGIDRDTAKHQVLRHSSRLQIEKRKKQGGGYRLYVTPESLISEKLLNNNYVPLSEGNKLLACSIVQKKFEGLSKTEQELLYRVDYNWEAAVATSKTELVNKLADRFAVSRATLYRHHPGDYRKSRKNAWEKLDPLQKQIVERIYMEHLNSQWFIRDCMNNPGLPDVSEQTWRRVWAILEIELQDEKTLRVKGPNALLQETEPILRDKTGLKFLQVIVGDYWRVDRLVVWNDGRLVRPALAVWIDFRTNMIVGVALSENPNSLGVKQSLLQVFTNYGTPEVAYMDNGKEYRAHRIIGQSVESYKVKSNWMDEVDSELKRFNYNGFLPALSVRNLHAIPRNARAKTIERIFGKGGWSDWAKGFADWTGGTYSERPEILRKAVKRYKKDGQIYKDADTGAFVEFVTLEQLWYEINQFVGFYNNRNSRGAGMDGKSPIELFKELTKDNPPKRTPYPEVAFAYMEGKKTKIRKNGLIEFRRDYFYRADELWAHRGSDVHIRYDPEDGSKIARGDGMHDVFLPNLVFVYDMKRNLIGEAVYLHRTHPTDADVSEAMRRNRAPLKRAKENLRAITRSDQQIPVVNVETKKSISTVVKEAEEEAVKREKEETLRRMMRFNKRW